MNGNILNPIANLQIAIVVDEQIFGLQIPVDEIQWVQILKGEHNLGRIKAGMGLREAANSTQMREHFATRNEFQHHIQVGIILKKMNIWPLMTLGVVGPYFEWILHIDEEGKIDGLQDSFLIQSVLNLLQFDHFLLVQYFHGKICARLFMLHQHHPSEWASAQGFKPVKIVQTWIVLQKIGNIFTFILFLFCASMLLSSFLLICFIQLLFLPFLVNLLSLIFHSTNPCHLQFCCFYQKMSSTIPIRFGLPHPNSI